jgi:hypothetical protein
MIEEGGQAAYQRLSCGRLVDGVARGWGSAKGSCDLREGVDEVVRGLATEGARNGAECGFADETGDGATTGGRAGAEGGDLGLGQADGEAVGAVRHRVMAGISPPEKGASPLGPTMRGPYGRWRRTREWGPWWNRRVRRDSVRRVYAGRWPLPARGLLSTRNLKRLPDRVVAIGPVGRGGGGSVSR